MKVSPDLVGRIVSIQLARPLYIVDYKAHVKTADGRTCLMGAPAITKNKQNGEDVPVVMEILIACDVIRVTEDSITVAMDINGNIIESTFPSALILNIAEVKTFDSDTLPTVTEHQRVQKVATKSGLIL